MTDRPAPTDGTLEALMALQVRLDRLDRGGPPWTRTTLRLIEKYPGVNGSALARRAGRDARAFRTNLRMLDQLGLTEQVGTGHQLSPLGVALLQSMS